jgi:hypothetical protein
MSASGETGCYDDGDRFYCSCYELGHQPLSIASAAAFLERAGYTPGTLDISVESFDVTPGPPATNRAAASSTA